MIDDCIRHVRDLFADAEPQNWSCLDIIKVDWEGDLETETPKLKNLVLRYAEEKEVVREDDKEESLVTLPNLFERIDNHKHFSDADFPLHCYNTVYHSYKTLAYEFSDLRKRMLTFRNLSEKDQEIKQRKGNTFYLADAMKEFIEVHAADHPYLCQLLRIGLVIPANVSTLERFFSAVKFINSDRRGALQDSTWRNFQSFHRALRT